MSNETWGNMDTIFFRVLMLPPPEFGGADWLAGLADASHFWSAFLCCVLCRSASFHFTRKNITCLVSLFT